MCDANFHNCSNLAVQGDKSRVKSLVGSLLSNQCVVPGLDSRQARPDGWPRLWVGQSAVGLTVAPILWWAHLRERVLQPRDQSLVVRLGSR